MLLEMHIHTNRHSPCSTLDPVVMVHKVMEKKLQGVVITEHGYLWGDEEIKALRKEAEVPDNFVILSGQEVSVKHFGHVIVFGVPESLTESYSLEELKARFPACVCIWAHPFRNNAQPKDSSLTHPQLDAVEIFNLNHLAIENFRALDKWHKLKFTAISGSDAHSAKSIGAYPTQFDHAMISLEELMEEIRAGRCRPFLKEIPKAGSNILVNEITIGTKGADETRSRLIVKKISETRKWKKERASAQLEKHIFDAGFHRGMYRVPKIIAIDEKEKCILEEGQRGKSLFDLLITVSHETGKEYFTMAAEWLAELHNHAFSVTTADEAYEKEKKRIEGYMRNFNKTNSPYADDARVLLSFLEKHEERRFSQTEDFVQNHGDYHPKNIIIGQDMMHDSLTRFISVIDFGSSCMMPPAFDVGYFLVQCHNQFRSCRELLEVYADALFIEAYSRRRDIPLTPFFRNEVHFFMLRSLFSIMSYLIKVGKGTSDDMNKLIDEAYLLYDSVRESSFE